MKKIGLPTTAEEIGIPIETIVKALTIAHKIRPNRYTILGEKGLTEEAAWRLVRETGII
ncbi:NAD(P)-dependent glycerol-1-phosphate dehydrogenase [compost metagenome]